ncbi:MAG: hypothetical protein ACI4PQ_03675 [Butyricicoccaceae bacterium]
MKMRWMLPAAVLALCLCACAPKQVDMELKDIVPTAVKVPDIEVDLAASSSKFPVPVPDEAKELAEPLTRIAEQLYPEPMEGCTGTYTVSYNGTQTTDEGVFYYFDLYDSYEEAEGSAEYAALCTIAVKTAPDGEGEVQYFLNQDDGYQEIRLSTGDEKTGSAPQD